MAFPDDIDVLVSRVHAQYAACGFKPSHAYQHTVLAAFLLESTLAGAPMTAASGSDNAFATPSGPERNLNTKLVSIATGSKCLPSSRYPPRGDALHDSHAEVLARRGVVRWLYEEIQRAAHTTSGSEWLVRRLGADGKWALRVGVKLHMYISTVPCGDASMRFLASLQDPAMAALKDSAPPAPPPPGTAARGRDNYSLFGVLRTKPGRADSPPTICMSCSDKIAAWNVLGVQGGLAACLFEPIYVNSIIIGDVPDAIRGVVKKDCERAFFQRLDGIIGLPTGYSLVKPHIAFTSSRFTLSQTALQASEPEMPPPLSSNESLCWFADFPTGHETIINGIRRGTGPKHRGIEKFRPRLCKLQLFKLRAETIQKLGLPGLPPDATYYDAKNDDAFQAARAALKGAGGPFAGWIVSGKAYESFDVEGNVTAIDE